MTPSEKLFEDLCRRSRVRFELIPTAEKQRTADYRIWLGGIETIAEVKQIERGANEQYLFGATDSAFSSDANTRIRKKFQKARKQLKNASGGHLPTLFVLYDNTGGFSELDNEDFLQAMYGNEVVNVYSTRSGNQPKVVRTFHTFEPRTGNVREGWNTSISCFCRLLNNETDIPLLYLFHNEFAANPLPTDVAKLIAFRQYIRPQSSQNEYRYWKLV